MRASLPGSLHCWDFSLLSSPVSPLSSHYTLFCGHLSHLGLSIVLPHPCLLLQEQFDGDTWTDAHSIHTLPLISLFSLLSHYHEQEHFRCHTLHTRVLTHYRHTAHLSFTLFFSLCCTHLLAPLSSLSHAVGTFAMFGPHLMFAFSLGASCRLPLQLSCCTLIVYCTHLPPFLCGMHSLSPHCTAPSRALLLTEIPHLRAPSAFSPSLHALSHLSWISLHLHASLFTHTSLWAISLTSFSSL